MKIVVILGLAMLMLSILGASAQPEEVWNKTFGGNGNDPGGSVQVTRDSGYILTGLTESYGAGGGDLWLIKTDSNGTEEWNKTIGGVNLDVGMSVQQAKDGGYIITGYTESYGNGKSDTWLIKTDSKGNKKWDNTFGGRDNDAGYSVQETKDDGYIIAGATSSYGFGKDDLWLIKTDSTGKEQWNKTFGGPGDDEGWSVVETEDSGFIVTGLTESYGAGSADAWLIKTDSDGNKEWDKTFGGSSGDVGRSVQEIKGKGYIITGWTNALFNEAELESDVLVVKTNSKGIVEWNKTFGGPGRDEGDWIKETKDGGYIIAGYTNTNATDPGDALLIKIDSDGTLKWTKAFGGQGTQSANSVQEIKDGYIIAGSTNAHRRTSYDIDTWLIKLKET